MPVFFEHTSLSKCEASWKGEKKSRMTPCKVNFDSILKSNTCLEETGHIFIEVLVILLSDQLSNQ